MNASKNQRCFQSRIRNMECTAFMTQIPFSLTQKKKAKVHSLTIMRLLAHIVWKTAACTSDSPDKRLVGVFFICNSTTGDVWAAVDVGKPSSTYSTPVNDFFASNKRIFGCDIGYVSHASCRVGCRNIKAQRQDGKDKTQVGDWISLSPPDVHAVLFLPLHQKMSSW